MKRKTKVGIIGAGIAGLTAASELSQFGFDITVMEATERIGGRVRTHYFDREKDLYGELGAMRIPKSHKYTMYYIKKFGLEIEEFPQSSPETFIYVKGVRVRNDSDGLSVSEYIYPLFDMTEKEKKTKWFDMIDYVGECPIYMMPEEVRPQIAQIKEEYSPFINYWDCLSTKKAMKVLGLSFGAIDMLSSIIPTVFPFWYDSHIEVLNEYYTGAFRDLIRIKGGFSQLPEAFYNSIIDDSHADVKFEFSRPVRGIRYDNRGAVVIETSDNDFQNIEYEGFDYIVCAIPFSCLRNVRVSPPFSPNKHQAIREVQYTESQKTLLLCNRRFWQDQGIDGGGSVTDLPISSIWYPKPGKIDEKAVFLASYNLNKDARRLGTQPIESRIEMIKRQVEDVHGLPRYYLDDIVEDYASVSWGSEAYELGCFFYFQPQQKRLFSWAMTTPEYDNRVFFAGEHVSNYHGWINGSIETALHAAEQIIKNKMP